MVPIDTSLMVMILAGVIVGIILIFVLIAFFLLPLSRRARRQKQKQQATTAETRPASPAVPAEAAQKEESEAEKTVPSAPPASQETEETVPSMLQIASVQEPLTTPISGERPANIGWKIAGLTDVGLRRELNEDNLIMIEGNMEKLGPYGLYVVADGLGGHEAGEVASQLTVEAVKKQHAHNPPTAQIAPFEEWLKDTINMANESVLQHQKGENNETSKMGSTLVMALVVGTKAHITNVGDSRAYHLNSQGIKQISVDHSLVERLVQIGQITREEARTHKQRNVIYSIIGEKRKLEIGYYHVSLNPGDRLLLCSDGLSGMVSDEELYRISQHEADPAKASQLMVEAAKQAGGHDNITAIIVQMS